ncbi:NACHT domain-containing protein [Streptomyces enissocaesilis]
MTTGILTSAAAYVATAPQACGQAPTHTRPQLLPLGSLEPKDFERLCYRVTRLEGTVEECRLFGVNGQAQDGIDLYARLQDGSYMVVQCKRSSGEFPAAKITAAVDVFLKGAWVKKCQKFVLAVTANMEPTQAADRIEEERSRLAQQGIAFEVWDETSMSAALKDHPRLVDDFFGREAVGVFCGARSAEALGERLDAGDVIEYRASLRRLYREVFRGLERGIHSDRVDVALEDRFVLPDVTLLERQHVGSSMPALGGSVAGAGVASGQEVFLRDRTPGQVSSAAGATAAAAGYAPRVQTMDWLASGSRHLVVGVPGAGKSALLRRLVLDVLDEEPDLSGGVDRLQSVLPLWLPFAFWTTAVGRDRECASVLGAVRSWLGAYDCAGLWPLVKRALDDDRLLLVIDGLDEWASPDAARLCLNRLEVFCGTKRVSVLASSRPFSTAELPIDTARWRTATLAPLDQEQRRAFIRKWLAPLMDAALVEQEAARWSAEVESSAHLAELADLPLFLSLLLRSREQRTEFPEDLHAVLSEVVARLIGEHRRRKIVTSGAADVFPTTGDIRKVSGATAEHMHRSSVITIGDSDLREVFRDALTDLIGYPRSEAHTIAGLLVNALSPGMGLMVRPAPDETQFFHRSVLEFLAAERLVAVAGDEQIALFTRHVTDGRWGQVLRFMLRGLVRPAEIANIFDALEAQAADNGLLGEAVDVLAAEVAVGTGAVDAPLRRRLLARVIREIETGARDAHRARLVELLVPGLARRELRTGLCERFGIWLDARPGQEYVSVLNAASKWERDDAALEMLWHGLLSDDDEAQRTAGRGLSRVFAGDSDVAERLAGLASTTQLWGRRAAATEALSLGWPGHSALDALIESGREHPHHAVMHASVAADLRRGNRGDAHRDALMGLFEGGESGSAWRKGLTQLLCDFFKDDDVLFDAYLRDADPTDETHFRYGEAPVVSLVLRCFPDRPEARLYFLKLLSSERGLFADHATLLVDQIPWLWVPAAWREDPEVIAAVEGLVVELAESPISSPQMYRCSLVVRTDAVRDQLMHRLLSQDGDWGKGWIIKALLEGWPQDPLVRQALTALIEGKPTEIPAAAVAYLDQIIADSDEALARLAGLVPGTKHQDAVVQSLDALLTAGIDYGDAHVDHLMQWLLDGNSDGPGSPSEELLYSSALCRHPAVHDQALARLAAHDAPLGAMAYGLRKDPHVRTALAGRMRALSAPLRVRLVEALAARPIAEAEATTLLHRPVRDPDQTVQIVAAAALARRHKSAGTVDDAVVSLFTELLQTPHYGHEGASAAGFCALAELGRLDILTDMTEPHAPGEPLTIRRSYLGDSSLLCRYVCRSWSEVKAVLGDGFARRFHSPTSSGTEFWQQILLVAHDYPTTYDDLTALLTSRPELAATAAGISFMWRSQSVPADLLWTATQSVLQASRALSYSEVQPAWTALRVLTEIFPDHPRTRAWVNELINARGNWEEDPSSTSVFLPVHGEVAALARLRPDTVTPSLLEATSPKSGRVPWARFLAWTELSAASSSSAQQFTDVALEIARIIARHNEFPNYMHQPLAARLRRDSDLATHVAALLPTLPALPQGVLARLLAMSGHLTGPLIEHLRRTAGSQSTPAEATFDPLTGRTVALQQLALDVLDTAGGQQPT